MADAGFWEEFDAAAREGESRGIGMVPAPQVAAPPPQPQRPPTPDPVPIAGDDSFWAEFEAAAREGEQRLSQSAPAPEQEQQSTTVPQAQPVQQAPAATAQPRVEAQHLLPEGLPPPSTEPEAPAQPKEAVEPGGYIGLPSQLFPEEPEIDIDPAAVQTNIPELNREELPLVTPKEEKVISEAEKAVPRVFPEFDADSPRVVDGIDTVTDRPVVSIPATQERYKSFWSLKRETPGGIFYDEDDGIFRYADGGAPMQPSVSTYSLYGMDYINEEPDQLKRQQRAYDYERDTLLARYRFGKEHVEASQNLGSAPKAALGIKDPQVWKDAIENLKDLEKFQGNVDSELTGSTHVVKMLPGWAKSALGGAARMAGPMIDSMLLAAGGKAIQSWLGMKSLKIGKKEIGLGQVLAFSYWQAEGAGSVMQMALDGKDPAAMSETERLRLYAISQAIGAAYASIEFMQSAVPGMKELGGEPSEAIARQIFKRLMKDGRIVKAAEKGVSYALRVAFEVLEEGFQEDVKLVGRDWINRTSPEMQEYAEAFWSSIVESAGPIAIVQLIFGMGAAAPSAMKKALDRQGDKPPDLRSDLMPTVEELKEDLPPTEEVPSAEDEAKPTAAKRQAEGAAPSEAGRIPDSEARDEGRRAEGVHEEVVGDLSEQGVREKRSRAAEAEYSVLGEEVDKATPDYVSVVGTDTGLELTFETGETIVSEPVDEIADPGRNDNFIDSIIAREGGESFTHPTDHTPVDIPATREAFDPLSDEEQLRVIGAYEAEGMTAPDGGKILIPSTRFGEVGLQVHEIEHLAFGRLTTDEQVAIIRKYGSEDEALLSHAYEINEFDDDAADRALQKVKKAEKAAEAVEAPEITPTALSVSPQRAAAEGQRFSAARLGAEALATPSIVSVEVDFEGRPARFEYSKSVRDSPYLSVQVVKGAFERYAAWTPEMNRFLKTEEGSELESDRRVFVKLWKIEDEQASADREAANREYKKREGEFWKKAIKGDRIFVRYGQPPDSGRSWNARDDRSEAGVSVYPAFRVGSTIYLDLREIDVVSGLFIAGRGMPVYLVSGDLLQEKGSDGEPLLTSLSYKKITPKSVHWLTTDPPAPLSTMETPIAKRGPGVAQPAADSAAQAEQRKAKRAFGRESKFSVDRVEPGREITDQEMAAVKERAESAREKAGERVDRERERLRDTTKRLKQAAQDDKVDLVKVSAELEAFVNAMPVRLRGLVKALGAMPKKKTPAARRKFLLDRISRIDAILGKAEDKTARNKILDLAKTKPVSSRGFPQGTRFGPGVQDQLKEILRTIAIPEQGVAFEMDKILADSPEGLTLEDADRVSTLMLYGDLKNKSGEQLKEALTDIRSLISRGKTAHRILMEAEREDLRQQAEVAANEFSGGGFELGEAEKRIQKEKRKSLFGRARSFLGDFHRKNLSFEWLVNNLSRPSPDIPTLGGETAQRLGTLAHKASQTEETGFREKSNAMTAALWDILIPGGRPTGVKGKLNLKAQNRFNKALAAQEELVENSGVFIAEGQETTARTLPASVAERHLQRWDTPEGRDQLEEAGVTQESIDSARRQLQDIADETSRRKTVVIPMVIDEGVMTERPLTQQEALQFSLMWQQPDVQKKMRGHGFDETTMAQIDDFLRPETKRIGEWLQEQYALEWDPINKVFKRLYHANLPQLENYAPATFQSGKKTDDPVLLDTQLEMSSVNPGSILSRVQHKEAPAQTSALGTYLQHTMQMEHFRAWGPAMRTLRGVLQNRQVKDVISQYASPEANRIMEKKLNDFARGGATRETVYRGLDAMRSGFTVSKLAANWGVFIKQLTSLPAYAMDLSAKDYFVGTTDFWKAPLKNAERLLNTDYVKNRWQRGFDRDVRRVLGGGNEHLGYVRRLMVAGMITGQLGDIMPIIVGGHAAYKVGYENAKADGQSDAAAEKAGLLKFEMTSDRSQQAANLKDLSFYQAGGSLARLFTMFSTAPRQYYSNMMEKVIDARAGKPGSKAAAFKSVLIGHVILPVLFQAATDLSRKGIPGDDDPRDEWKWQDYLRAVMTGPYNGLFIAGDWIEDIAWALMAGKNWRGDSVPIFGTKQKFIQASVKVHDMIADGEVTPQDVADVADKYIEGISDMRGDVYGVAKRLIKPLIKDDERSRVPMRRLKPMKGIKPMRPL